MAKMKTRELTLISLFAALIAVFSQIIIALPVTPVPINLATLAVMLVGALLGTKLSAICLVVYLAVGSIGIPVFTGFRGGVSALVGPTGGYLAGYLLMAVIIGFFAEKNFSTSSLAVGIALGTFVLYALGTAWFMFLTKRTLAESLMMCVVPFLIGDTIKSAVAIMLAKRLKRHVKI